MFLICFTSIFKDLSSHKNYVKEREALISETNLKRQYCSLCTAYNVNEYKLYRRLAAMMSSSVIDRMSKELINYKPGDNLKMDFAYREKCIVNRLRSNRDEFLKKSLGIVWYMKMKAIQGLYTFLENNSSRHIKYDILHLYNNIIEKNSLVLKTKEVRLDKYFSNKFEFIFECYKKAKHEYDMLQDREHVYLVNYEKATDRTIDYIKKFKEQHKKNFEEEEDLVNLNYDQMRKE